MEGYITISEKHYNELADKLDKLLKRAGNGPEGLGDWIPEKRAKELLGKGTTTLWEMRQKGYLTHSRINGSVYYSKKGIVDLLEKNKVKAYC